jgi:hypothetical protein
VLNYILAVCKPTLLKLRRSCSTDKKIDILTRFQRAKKDRLVTHFSMYTNILNAPTEMDFLGLQRESMDFTEVAQYRFH